LKPKRFKAFSFLFIQL